MPRRPRIGSYSGPSPLRLREWLQHSGLTQADMAERMGCAQTTVSRILNGKQMLSLPAQAAFAEAVGCKPVDLFRRPDEVSIDALLADADDETRDAAVRVVLALIEKNRD